MTARLYELFFHSYHNSRHSVCQGMQVRQRLDDQCYQYRNLNSRKYFDVFWAGYGAYLSPSEESATKTILKYRGNEKRATFTHLAVENVFGIRLGKSRKPKELSDFSNRNQIALFLRIMKFCCQIAATRGIKDQKVQCLRTFFDL